MKDYALPLSDVLLKTIQHAQKLAHINKAHTIFLEVLNGLLSAQSKQEVVSLYEQLKEHCPDVANDAFLESRSLELLRTELSTLVMQEMLKAVSAKKETAL